MLGLWGSAAPDSLVVCAPAGSRERSTRRIHTYDQVVMDHPITSTALRLKLKELFGVSVQPGSAHARAERHGQQPTWWSWHRRTSSAVPTRVLAGSYQSVITHRRAHSFA